MMILSDQIPKWNEIAHATTRLTIKYMIQLALVSISTQRPKNPRNPPSETTSYDAHRGDFGCLHSGELWHAISAPFTCCIHHIQWHPFFPHTILRFCTSSQVIASHQTSELVFLDTSYVPCNDFTIDKLKSWNSCHVAADVTLRRRQCYNTFDAL